jgi:hypothetical protein
MPLIPRRRAHKQDKCENARPDPIHDPIHEFLDQAACGEAEFFVLAAQRFKLVDADQAGKIAEASDGAESQKIPMIRSYDSAA